MYWTGPREMARVPLCKLALIFINNGFQKIAWLKRLRASPASILTAEENYHP
jgi:hypothetical protein